MGIDKSSVLLEMYKDFLQDRENENKKLQNNLNRINEIDVYLHSVREDVESDFKVFSPRSAEKIYKDEIEQVEGEKADIEKENQYLSKRLEELDKRIQELETIIKDFSFKEKDNNYRHLRVLDIQEKDRQRISRELHDSSVQNLTHLVHTIELGSMFIDQDPLRAKLELASCIKNLKLIIDEIRETIFDLRPMSFDDLGFKDCIEEFIRNLKMQYSNKEIEIQANICDIKLDECFKCSDKDKEAANLLLVTVYRIIQEALINSFKHSDGDKVDLTISLSNNKFYIIVKDNGKGFCVGKIMDQRDKHFGMSIMKERIEFLNGTFDINSCEQGTEIKIEIPLL